MISQKIQDNGIKEDKKGYFSIRRNSMDVSGKLKKNRIEKMVVFKEIQKNLFLKPLVVFEGGFLPKQGILSFS
jgi:hypothetical protein